MKKKFISLSILTLLIMLIGLFPNALVVKADKTDGQWVSVSQTFGKQIAIIPGERWRTDSGIFQLRGWQYRYTAILTVGATIYPLFSIATYDGVFNPNTGVVNLRYDVVWYWYTGPAPAVSANGFAGNFESKLTNVITYPPPVYGPEGGGETIHCVLQGFGDFEGQILTLSYEGPVHGGDLTGFLLIK